MDKWSVSVQSSSVTVKLGAQTVLSELSAAITTPGGKPQILPPGQPTVAGVPFGRDLFISALPADDDPSVLILRVRYCGGPVDGQQGIQLRIGQWNGVDKALASYRFNTYWTRPMVLTDLGQMPEKTQYLLAHRQAKKGAKGKYLAVLPLTYGGMRGELRAVDGQAALTGLSLDDRYTPCGFILGAIALGDDPYELTHRLFAAGLGATGAGRLREDKAVPPFVDDFGWCSWNAFYQNVTEKDIVDALKTFQAGKLPVGTYILDDGWQSVATFDAKREDGTEHKPAGLTAFEPNEKFPTGLASLIHRVKSETGLRHFGVWHAFQGYWGGVHPQSELAQTYATYVDHTGNCIVQPEDCYRFYSDYHSYLRGCGIDFVKVDNQSGLELNTQNRYPVGYSARVMHQALDGSVAVHFRGQIINCMSMSSDILLQLPYVNVARNSDDYYPWRPNNPGLHISDNAFNNLWTSQLVIPDWDMFESHHPQAEFHAMARAISGSPVYCTDYPGKQNFDLLRKLVLSGGRALRCPEPAQVTEDCLFIDAINDPVLLKIGNTLPGGHGLLGIFNCRMTPDVTETPGQAFVYTAEQLEALRTEAKYAPADVRDLRDPEYAVFSHRTGELRRMARRERAAISLAKYESELLVLAPVENDLAVLGLIDKFNSPGAIVAWGMEGRTLLVQLADGGSAGFYCKRAPKKVIVNDKPVKSFRYDKKSGLLVVKIRPGKTAVVEVMA